MVGGTEHLILSPPPVAAMYQTTMRLEMPSVRARVRAGDGGRRASRILNVSFALDSPFSRAADADEGNGAAWQVWEKGTGRVRRQAGWVYSGREGPEE